MTRPPFPRTGGGDPWGGIPTGITQNRTVPRIRGGDPFFLRRGPHTKSFPRIRGGDPIEEQKKAVRAGIPRMCGGDPYAKSVTIESATLSPHGRGRLWCAPRCCRATRHAVCCKRPGPRRLPAGESLARLFFAPCGREEEAQRASDRGGRKRRIHNSQTILSKITNKGVAE